MPLNLCQHIGMLLGMGLTLLMKDGKPCPSGWGGYPLSRPNEASRRPSLLYILRKTPLNPNKIAINKPYLDKKTIYLYKKRTDCLNILGFIVYIGGNYSI
jgi:hypothetical protein